MENQGGNGGGGDADLFKILVAGAIGIALIYVVLIIAVLICMGIIAASAIAGIKMGKELAYKSEEWEDSHVRKYKQISAQHRRERGYYLEQGDDVMVEVLDAQRDDQVRELYRPPEMLKKVVSTVKQMKEMLK